MSARPRVSVCIPTVDRPDLLREAIGSVARQTWKDLEVIVADNSADPRLQRQIDDVLGEFRDLAIVLKRHPARLDAIDNFNSLIDAAQGELWACLPDDDRFTPDFLELSVAALDRHPECAFTFADHAIMRANGEVDEALSRANSIKFARAALHERVYHHDELFPLVLKQAICLQTALFRRPVVAGLRFVPGIMAGDHSFFLRLSTGQTRFEAYYIPKRLFEYRIHEAQITSTTKRRDLLKAQIASYATAGTIPRRYRAAFNEKVGRCHLALALLDAEEGDLASARAYAARSLRLSPRPRTIAAAALILVAPSAISSLRDLTRRFTFG
ncbi:MAG TPA: glycosyltransferase family 2 protein [Polyangia bacterium]|nr:glycosyltransferase family 2 protein [Polyangia bacterium]